MIKILAYLHRNKKCSIVLAITWTALIFYGCSLPGKELPSINLFDQFDKVVHFTFFFIFFLFWHIVFSKSSMAKLFLLFLSFSYGLGIEYYQKYCVAGRGFDIWDVVADTFGALVCYLIVFRLSNKIV